MTIINNKLRIGIVDDHPLYREGVATTLRGEASFDVVGTGANGVEAVRIATEHRPDLMLLDFNMRDGGVPLVAKLLEIKPDLKIVFLTVSESETHVSETLKAGACGYLLKSASGSELASALRSIGSGESYVMPELAAKLLSQMHMRKQPSVRRPLEGLDCLRKREERILQLVAGGATNKEIARALDISEKTVKHYMTTIMQKLNVRNRVEAASLLINSARHGNGPEDASGKI